MESNLEVLFTPAEFSALDGQDLSQVVCVVFDVLRATSSMLTALANGASSIIPVLEISHALELRGARPGVVLAGERDGVRILGAQTGGVDFDLGNSPREFTPEAVAGREIIIPTTNGTRALHACRGARRILPGGFLNLRALAKAVEEDPGARLLVICAGTFEEAAYEDTLAAGALCCQVWKRFEHGPIADSAQIARQIYLGADGDLGKAMQYSRNARRLLSNPALSQDVAFCLRTDCLDLVAELHGGGVVVSRRGR